jgi:hypothetical protein
MTCCGLTPSSVEACGRRRTVTGDAKPICDQPKWKRKNKSILTEENSSNLQVVRAAPRRDHGDRSLVCLPARNTTNFCICFAMRCDKQIAMFPLLLVHISLSLLRLCIILCVELK